MVLDNQPGRCLDAPRARGSDSTDGRRPAASLAAAALPAARKPGTGDRWCPNIDSAEAHKPSYVRRKDRETCLVRGAENPRRQITPGGRDRRQDGGRDGSLWTYLGHGRERLDDGASGYVVVCRKGQTWVFIKTRMGDNPDAYEAVCAALAKALETASRRKTTPERVTIFGDAQATI